MTTARGAGAALLLSWCASTNVTTARERAEEDRQNSEETTRKGKTHRTRLCGISCIACDPSSWICNHLQFWYYLSTLQRSFARTLSYTR